jgi:hypothetical protein
MQTSLDARVIALPRRLRRTRNAIDIFAIVIVAQCVAATTSSSIAAARAPILTAPSVRITRHSHLSPGDRLEVVKAVRVERFR